ncbi:MAG: ADP-dependent NAD(P)H-hydrate dehydratase [Microbacteriaceae bacterium]
MTGFTEFTSADAAGWISVPSPGDDKYSRGVLGVITGSERYPGAAVLGVEAALRTGVGMVRYIGPRRAADLVLQRRPEAVNSPGRVNAWLIGSGMDHDDRDSITQSRCREAVAEGVPVVIDGGALDLVGGATGPVVITPHYRELARLWLGRNSESAHAQQGDPSHGASLRELTASIAAEPAAWAVRAAEEWGVTVLLKGHETWVASAGLLLVARSAPAWLATAGAGDALGGILGALVATNMSRSNEAGWLARVAATASVIHGLAAGRACAGGPCTILDLAREVSPVIASLVSER